MRRHPLFMRVWHDSGMPPRHFASAALKLHAGVTLVAAVVVGTVSCNITSIFRNDGACTTTNARINATDDGIHSEEDTRDDEEEEAEDEGTGAGDGDGNDGATIDNDDEVCGCWLVHRLIVGTPQPAAICSFTH